MWTVIAQKPDLLYMSMLVNVLKIIVIIIIIKEHPVFILSWQVHLNRAKPSHNQHWAIQPPNEGATRHEAMKLWDPATRCDGLPQIPLFYFVWFFWLFGFVKKKENVFGTLSNTPVTYLYIVNMYFNLLMSYNKYDQCSWWAGVSNCTRAETRSHLRKKDKILFFFLIYISITNIIAWQTCIGIGVCLAKCFLTLFLMRLCRELCLLLGSNWTPFACQAKWLHYEAIFTDERCLETVFSVYPAVDLPLCYLHRSHSLCSTE